MFNKNDFKEKFRSWSEQNMSASFEEAKVFCDIYIPEKFKKEYAWLEEQTLAWFIWKKENLAKKNSNQTNELNFMNYYVDERKIM